VIVLEGHPFEWEVAGPTAVTIGVFDGVHVGHQRVIGDLVTHARAAGLVPTVLTFDPHPLAVLSPDKAPLMLTTVAQRIDQFRRLAVEVVGILTFADIRDLTADEFAHRVLGDALAARRVVVGADFRFGRERTGDATSLSRTGDERGFEVAVVDMFGHLDGVVSSTRIRHLVQSGNVDQVATLLARPYELRGIVARGDGRGRTIGVPTANLEVGSQIAIPANGVYAVWGATDGGEWPAVVNIGVRPTFGQTVRVVEAHLLDFNGDIYGQELAVAFITRLRDEQRFASVDDLVSQIEDDIAVARSILGGSIRP
jgi:riboflavin kinase/FMN adenylyltransferase